MMNDNVGLTIFIQVLAVMQNVMRWNHIHVMVAINSSHRYIESWLVETKDYKPLGKFKTKH